MSLIMHRRHVPCTYLAYSISKGLEFQDIVGDSKEENRMRETSKLVTTNELRMLLDQILQAALLKRGTSNNLKVVHSGTKEFKIGSNNRDLFLGFSEHQERLRKKLALEDGRIFVANEQLC
ncbi:hypothetical protein HKD37_01G001191 [Glycine soja]